MKLVGYKWLNCSLIWSGDCQPGGHQRQLGRVWKFKLELDFAGTFTQRTGSYQSQRNRQR
jgi:hypothetical protein